jgi:hypothetical protein
MFVAHTHWYCLRWISGVDSMTEVSRRIAVLVAMSLAIGAQGVSTAAKETLAI